MEDNNPIKKTVVIYVGRFQPMHKGHYGTYQHLVKKFGKDNVYVGTSDKVERPKSPFNFKEKVKIMTTMFGIPKSKIHRVKNPYKPTEILKKFDEETTAFVTVVGEKDKNRLGGKYFQPYKGEPSVGYRDGGYVYVAPSSGGGISGTETRNGLSVGSDDQKKDFFKKRAYGKFNATIFKMITDKLDEGIEISKEMIEEWLLNESSKMGSGQADDGPNFMFPNYDVFSKINVERAKRIGYEVVNMITTKELEDYYDHPIYPNGPVGAVTPFPAGILGTTTANNQVDIYSTDAYSKWFKHVTRKAALVGYELVKGLGINKDEKEKSLDTQKGDKQAQEEYEASLNENIVLPIKVGDTIMTGRFKNKKTVVKSIGKDEHGMPTINGRKVVNFRMVKEGFISELAGTEVKCEKCNHQWEIESDDSEKYLCHSCGWDSQKGEYDFDAFDSWKEKMGLNEELDERGKMRPSDKLRRKAAMAGKRAQIARRRARTMKRRKPLAKLKKIAYKMAYRQVYDEFAKDLFPDIKKSDLSIKQSQVVHKNVVRKKGRIMKRAKFRFLPALRQKEFDKFQGKNENMIGYAGPEDMKRFDKQNKEYRKTADSDKEYQYEPIKEGLKELGITDFKSLFKKMPSDLQKRVYNLKNFGQRVDKHPEGNVLKHTIKVVNRSIKEDDIDIAIAAMFHDIGKDETAGIHPKKGHITHFGHEKVSASLVKKYRKFIEDVGGNTANVFYIVKNHMKYKQLSVMRPKKADKVKSFRAFDKLGKFSKHDRGGLDESKDLKLRVPSDIIKIQKGFKKNGKKLYVVGGAVRDAILGKSPKDFDLATDAKPDEVLKIAKDLGMKTVEVGKSFGVVVVGGHEIATFRKDIGKGRRPSSVDYTDIEGDVRRRDLTINALFYDIDRKEIVDLVGGIADLKKKNIRTVGKASERFDEDPLRKLRALRFQARLGGNLDKELLDALQKDPSLKGVSFERVRDEVIKSIKSAKDTKKYMELNDKIGFTSLIFPNLKISKPYIKDNDYILFLASLFKKNSPSVLGKQLNKLTYSNDEKNNIVFLVSLQHFRPEEIVVFKKLQEKTSLSDDQILKFGKLVGKDMKKFVNFNLSIGGKDVPSDIKGPEIGLWIKNKEKEKFMNEIEQLISDIDNKLVEMFLPNTKTPQQLIKENINESKLLQEGGAYGHMSHPFDTDINLTFGQLKDIVNRALEGTLEFTREKTDGQALAISWRDGRLVAARNKGHLKNRGENALDIKGVSDKFQGRGGLSDAYNYAMKDLSNAIKSLSDKQRDKIFKQGACFMNLEVIYPTSVNVIPYGQALLVFHGTMEFNEEGVAIGENGEAARVLAGMIKQVNKDVQDNYTIQGPPIVKLPKSQDLSKKRSKYSSQISKLQKEFSLKDTDGVANYHQAWWEQWVDKNSPSSLDNKTKMGLVKRWAFMDKGFRLDKKNITDEKTLEWAKKTDKEDQKKISKKNLMKFEQIFLGLGAEVLEFTSSALTVNADSAVRDMKKRIDQTIKDVKKSGDPKKIEKLKLELGRLNSIGGSKKIVPNEGIVFLYKGNTFKLTGTFASVNQILGIFF
jgi:tRNA nucleotidyltransferase/poly(A) polymerase/Zn finger protein HypA/HybF involved in hydrogenase expression